MIIRNVFPLLIVLFVVGLFFVISGCSSALSDEVPTTNLDSSTAPYIGRYIDDEAGVVCWLWDSGGYKGGLSCLPIADTKLSPAGDPIP